MKRVLSSREFTIPLPKKNVLRHHGSLTVPLLQPPIRHMPLSIIHYPHPTLRLKSLPIRRVDQGLRDLAAEMLELMYLANGVGLAANQVNLPLRMFVVNVSGIKGEGEELVLINPELSLPKGNEYDNEGCLSLPGLNGQVRRPKSIRLSAYDIQGNLIERNVDGFFARVLMHEYDHLDGILFFDRMEDEAREPIVDAISAFEINFRAAQAEGKIASDRELLDEIDHWRERYA